MTPKAKHDAGILMLHVYRGIILAMLSFCTFFLHELYLDIRKSFTEIEKLKEDRREHETKHLIYDATIIELKSKVNFLYEHKYDN
jgi:hypothetical protein